MLQADLMNGDLLKTCQMLRRLHKSYFDLFTVVRGRCLLLVPCFTPRTSLSFPNLGGQGNFLVPSVWEQGKKKVGVPYLHAQEQHDKVLSPSGCKVFYGKRPNKLIESLQMGTERTSSCSDSCGH